MPTDGADEFAISSTLIPSSIFVEFTCAPLLLAKFTRPTVSAIRSEAVCSASTTNQLYVIMSMIL